MTGIYLFEAKSIQSYLGRSGKLKNVVEVSDALSNLIDDTSSSKLYDVMKAAGLLEKSDLIDNKPNSSTEVIHFFRAKGGSFYCWSSNISLLEKLRSFWLLYFQNSFPEMMFNDVLLEGTDSFSTLLDKAFKKLQEGNNVCQVAFPVAGAIAQSTPRTGSPAVRSSKGEYQDLCAVCMSEVQNSKELKLKLYNKTLEKSSDDDYFIDPNDLIENFNFMSEVSDNYNDIALIHLDGNGMGQTLMALKDALKGNSAEAYTKHMRDFSGMLESVTVRAVQKAMKTILEKASERDIIPFYRPLVIGGDDVTLLLEPCYAYDFVINFCREFRIASEKEIESRDELNKALSDAGLPKYLTASGGVLFNKKSHPFFNSLRLVEGLAEMAKSLTKHRPDSETYNMDWDKAFLRDIYAQNERGEIYNNQLYSAVAVFRMSAAETGNVSSLIKNSRISVLHEDNTEICTGGCVYFVNRDEFRDTAHYKDILTLEDIRNAVTETDAKDLSKVMGRMRRITGHIMSGSGSEYKRELSLMRRAFEEETGEKNLEEGIKAIKSLTDKVVYAWDRLNYSKSDDKNYISKFIRSSGIREGDEKVNEADSKKKICIFDDLIVAHHFINGKYAKDIARGEYANKSDESYEEDE